MKKGFTLLAAILTLFGCNTQKKSDSDAETKKSKYLVVYYSQTGATQSVAQKISQLLGADTLRIDAAQPYNGKPRSVGAPGLFYVQVTFLTIPSPR